MAVTWNDTPWVGSTAYLVGDRVYNVDEVYLCTSAGTSASSGGPTGTGTDPITDGTVTWQWLGAYGSVYVSGIAPELAATVRGMQVVVLKIVEGQVGSNEWGDLFDEAYATLAAHFATLFLRAGAGGAITAEALGQMSASYATPKTVLDSLASTSYGLIYDFLLHQLGSSVGLVP